MNESTDVDEALLRSTTDAHVWAQEFMKLVEDSRGDAIDEGTMIGWFANAIEAGRDAGRKAATTPRDKVMSIEEFWSKGWLMEVNRLFFHPHGLAMSIDVNTGHFKILDGRDDAEGYLYYDDQFKIGDLSKAAAIEMNRVSRAHARSKHGCDFSGIQQIKEPGLTGNDSMDPAED